MGKAGIPGLAHRRRLESFPDRRERLEKHDQEDIALVWLAVSEIEGILRGFDVLEAAGALTVEQRVLQEDLIDLLAGGEAAEVERL